LSVETQAEHDKRLTKMEQKVDETTRLQIRKEGNEFVSRIGVY